MLCRKLIFVELEKEEDSCYKAGHEYLKKVLSLTSLSTLLKTFGQWNKFYGIQLCKIIYDRK